MKFPLSLTAVLLICIILTMAKLPDEEFDKCRKAVNRFRKEAGLGELKEDKQETARLEKTFVPGTKNCPTKDHLKNGLDGFTVTRIGQGHRLEPVIVPNMNSILSQNVKTFACLDLDCKDHHDVFFAFIKNGVAGKSIRSGKSEKA
ncbi:hypothetical protein B9Z55_017215 [Caenorhabditis nigoni]|uniref:SCP domain-containing protein n=1 Tax=Caenorhabditis nigoni TaxID=1611254 RepID=A0A2G5T8M6_9PELO|nr:hypothetical protein B9Z55_017215 [Caenorhabditis nigoni]